MMEKSIDCVCFGNCTILENREVIYTHTHAHSHTRRAGLAQLSQSSGSGKRRLITMCMCVCVCVCVCVVFECEFHLPSNVMSQVLTVIHIYLSV